MEDTVLQKVQEHCKSDRYSTQNEFIAKAIMFYCGYLQSEYTGDFLPKILGETLEAVLSMFGDRIGTGEVLFERLRRMDFLHELQIKTVQHGADGNAEQHP